MVRIVSGSVPVLAEASGKAMLDDGGAMLGEEEATNGVCARAGNRAVAITTASRYCDQSV